MRPPASSRLACGGVAALAACLVGPARAQAPTESLPARLYEVVTETGMPHLEENLRYAVRRERRCLGGADLAGAFWMLRHESLQDCRLEPAAAGDDGAFAAYRLECNGGHGTTGRAWWIADGETLRGTLAVRLGGKNMTFHQRITARPVGACAPD